MIVILKSTGKKVSILDRDYNSNLHALKPHTEVLKQKEGVSTQTEKKRVKTQKNA